MIPELISCFDKNREKLLAIFKEQEPESYEDILRVMLEVIVPEDDYEMQNRLDAARIVKVDHGDYQGTLLFAIAEQGCTPSRYWITKVRYGSCSACDTLYGIRCDSSSDDAKANDYLTLALHMLQGLKEV